MGFDDHLDAASFRVRRELAHAGGDAFDQCGLGFVREVLVAEDANVRRLQLRGEIDEAASLVHLPSAFFWLPLAQLSGRPEACDTQVSRA